MLRTSDTFKMTLGQSDLMDFYGRVEATQGQTLETIAADDPMVAYILMIEESMTRGELNGLIFSHRQLDSEAAPGSNMIPRELRRRIPDPSQQAVRVEIRSWPTDTGQPARPDLVAHKVLGFVVGPLEPVV